MKMKHFLITRFNLQLWKADKKRSSTRTDRWLEERFRLFETYCLPSVCAQSTKDFTWLCLFDDETPEIYREKIEKYGSRMPQMVPCFFDKEQTDHWKTQVKDIVKSLLTDEEYVITTNLDNDDAIHNRMIEIIQQEFKRIEKTGLYIYETGLQYFPHLNLLMKMTYPHNHFQTYIERTDSDFKTAIHIRHAEAKKEMQNVISIPNKPYWIEIVHSNNVNNDLRITSRIKYSLIWNDINLQEYGLSTKISKKQAVNSNLFQLPLLFIKIVTLKLLRKIRPRKNTG